MANTLRTLDPKLAALAKSECNEEQAQRAEIIATIQTWITKSPHLKAPTDEQLILAFLRRCRFSQEETKRRFDNYYSLRSVFPEVLGSRQVDEALLTQLQRGWVECSICYIPFLPQAAKYFTKPYRIQLSNQWC